jgi:putative FmdB family regulatory protein
MPAYEFICNYCGNKGEVLATVSEKERGLDLFCENCGSTDVKQIISKPMPLLRGISSGSCGSRSGGCC